MSARILIVDDEPLNIELLVELLKENYRTLVAKNGQQALQRAQSLPDLILLDVMMPDMDGYSVCAQLKADPKTAHIPIIFVTAMNDVDAEMRGFALGAVDYITKPISPPIVQARVHNHLQLHAARQALEQHNQQLEQLVAERTREVELTQDVTILCMASLAETRDTDTGNHIRRTQHYVRLLAKQLCTHPRFQAELSEQNITLLFKSAPLHDIGKIGIPDHILLKPERLDPVEFELMKRHAVIGYELLKESESTILQTGAMIALTHHEKFDGSGYPYRVLGDAIPLFGRIVAVADVFDALTSARPYKPAWSLDAAADYLREHSGRHFDPVCVDAFFSVWDDVLAVHSQYRDERCS